MRGRGRDAFDNVVSSVTTESLAGGSVDVVGALAAFAGRQLELLHDAISIPNNNSTVVSTSWDTSKAGDVRIGVCGIARAVCAFQEDGGGFAENII